MVKSDERFFFRVFKITLLSLLLTLLLTNKGWAQECNEQKIKFLIAEFKENDDRWNSAVKELGKCQKSAVEPLRGALKYKDNDKDIQERVRAGAVSALGEIGSGGVDALIEALNDKNERIRSVALQKFGQIGSDEKNVLAALSKLLLQDSSRSVRANAAFALAQIRPQEKNVVVALIKALEDKNETVRDLATLALAAIGSYAKPELLKALKSPHVEVRLGAAEALGRIGEEVEPAVSALIKVLKDSDAQNRRGAIKALNSIAEALRDKRVKTLPTANLEKAITALDRASKTLDDLQRESTDVSIDEEIEKVKDSLNWTLKVLGSEKASRDRSSLEKVLQYPGVLPTGIYLISLSSLWLILFWLHPLSLLWLNNLLKLPEELPLPFPTSGITVAFRYLLLIKFVSYHPRVLDAWVAKYIKSARQQFQQKQTVRVRQIHIPVPVILDDKKNAPIYLTPADLRITFGQKRGCLLIWGEGGAGKTSLACQIAQWAMSEDERKRPCEHLMLPIFLEEDIKVTEGKDPLVKAIRGQLQDLIDVGEPISEELLERLLRTRRVLAIADRFSEMNSATRQQIRPESDDFMVNALVVTSRQEETLGQVTKNTIQPCRIEGSELTRFMEDYLRQRGKLDLFSGQQLHYACGDLSRLLEEIENQQRSITVLLAKLYAEVLIAVKEGKVEDNLPNNIPDLMLSYLNELNRNVTSDRNGTQPEEKFDDRTVHKDAKALAWLCLKQHFRPARSKYEDAIAALGGDNAQKRLQYLENRLRFIQIVGAAKDEIRFDLDPLAEYLAGLHLMELYGKDEQSWRDFLVQVDVKLGEQKAIRGFLLAVWDCCIASGTQAKVPAFVSEELGKRAGLHTATSG